MGVDVEILVRKVPARLKKLESKGGYVWRVLRAVRQLEQVRPTNE